MRTLKVGSSVRYKDGEGRTWSARITAQGVGDAVDLQVGTNGTGFDVADVPLALDGGEGWQPAGYPAAGVE